MAEIIDLDELVPDDIVFKYKGGEYTLPGDLRTEDTLKLYALLQRLAETEAKGTADELKRVITQTEAALLPLFQIHHPEMERLPFGATALGHVLRRVLALLGLLQTVDAEAPTPVPPAPAPQPNRAQRRQPQKTRKTTKPGSGSRTRKKTAAGSSRSSS